MTSVAPASNYTYKTFEDLTEYAKGMLGGNLVDVELTTDDYLNAWNQAKSMWFQRGNVNLNETYTLFNVVTGQTVYDFSQGNAAIDTCLELIKPTDSFYTNNPFSIAIFTDIMTGLLSQQSADIYTFVGTLQFIDTINLLFVNNPLYIWNRRSQQLTLLKAPLTNAVWFLHGYSFPVDIDLYNTVWVRAWMVAECKHILGMAYQKFGSIMSPAGETTLDGSALITEANEEKTQLLQDIQDYVDGDETGGLIGLF